MLTRVTSSGSVDATYGNNGYVATPIGNGAGANGVVILNTDGAVIAGYGEPVEGTSVALAQYDTFGSLDGSFNGTGIATILIGDGSSAHAIGLDSSGNYVTTGVAIISGTPTTAVTRTLPDGTPDSSFGTDGVVTTQIDTSSIGNAIAIQADGQIIVAGNSSALGTPNFAVARYNYTDGSLDTSFNSGGILPGTVSTPVGADCVAVR